MWARRHCGLCCGAENPETTRATHTWGRGAQAPLQEPVCTLSPGPVPGAARGWDHTEKRWQHLSSVLQELGQHMHSHFWTRCPSGTFVTATCKAATLTTSG